VLADEINRASPRTQSALLEAMAEQQVSIDGHTHHLPSPFFVIATQNPLDMVGTYPFRTRNSIDSCCESGSAIPIRIRSVRCCWSLTAAACSKCCSPNWIRSQSSN